MKKPTASNTSIPIQNDTKHKNQDSMVNIEYHMHPTLHSSIINKLKKSPL